MSRIVQELVLFAHVKSIALVFRDRPCRALAERVDAVLFFGAPPSDNLFLRRFTMAFRESTGFCKYCKKQVLARAKSANHILHFFLTVFTAGLWIPIWIFCSLNTYGRLRCTQCGQRISGPVRISTKWVLIIIIVFLLLGVIPLLFL
jgi:hypothetical protein